MLKEVILPTLGLDIEEATIEKWLKSEGDSVNKDEPLVVVETDKATTEINAPVTGVLQRRLQQEGACVPVTHTIAIIATEPSDEVLDPTPVVSEAFQATQERRSDFAGVRTEGMCNTFAEHGRPQERKVRASPAARRIAMDLGVDISMVKGSGPDGRIQGDDVRRFAAEATTDLSVGKAASVGVETQVAPPKRAGTDSHHEIAGLPGRLLPLSRKRRITAERMATSARTVARITLNMEVDAEELVSLRTQLLPKYEALGLHLTYDALLAKVVAVALVDHPNLNARWTDEGIYLIEPVNLGIAVAVDDGLVVPVVREANRKSLAQIVAELSKLAQKAKEDRLAPENVSGGTFTITNLGMFGIESFTPIVNPPEVAILGVGCIAKKPVDNEGEVMVRPRMALSLSADHRVVDGAPAAQFLQRVKQLLEAPYLLL